MSMDAAKMSSWFHVTNLMFVFVATFRKYLGSFVEEVFLISCLKIVHGCETPSNNKHVLIFHIYIYTHIYIHTYIYVYIHTYRLYQATLMSCGTAKHVSVDCTIYIYNKILSQHLKASTSCRVPQSLKKFGNWREHLIQSLSRTKEPPQILSVFISNNHVCCNILHQAHFQHLQIAERALGQLITAFFITYAALTIKSHRLLVDFNSEDTTLNFIIFFILSSNAEQQKQCPQLLK